MSDPAVFAELLSEVTREVTRRKAVDVCCGALTLEQFQTLKLARRTNPPTVGSLSRSLGVDLSTMSRNVSVLERDGYLTRARSERDGRIVHIQLTAKGRRALQTLRCSERDVLEDIFARLPSDQRPQIVEALTALRLCLFATAPEAASCCSP